MVLDDTIAQLHATAVQQLDSAATLEAIEAVRVEFLGRKGKLTEISKEFGKLAPEERARIGKLHNAVKRELEGRIESSKAALELRALDERLAAAPAVVAHQIDHRLHRCRAHGDLRPLRSVARAI